ncbi:MAG: S1C family serine protease [Butyrivibrio sp.]|nr:S1C family serine protease [Butyrivibrio sp.]
MPLGVDDNNEKLANTDFISEKIKQRPINRKKLLRRTVITVSLAIVFGIVACFTFLLLQPVFSDRLYPEEAPEAISFPEETVSEELTPEDMLAYEETIAASEAQSLEATQKDQIDEAIASYSFDASDYGKMMASLKKVADETSKSIVTVTALSNDTNWFSDSFESSGSASGLVIANNGTNYYILVPSTSIDSAESIQVTFCDGSVATAEVSLTDTITSMSVLTVRRTSLTESTRKKVQTATLGSSNTGKITGNPVIAIGSPLGVQGSLSYGIITSEKTPINLADSNYKLLTTDMDGSSKGSGVLTNLNGQILGIINMNYNSSDLSDHISAIGITELKALIEDLSNARNRAYLGVHGATVPSELQQQLNIPAGAYISTTDMGSPAMKAGLQSGDIITSVAYTEIASFEQLVGRLAQLAPDDIITVTVMRQAPNDYVKLDLEVTLSSSTHN